MKPPRINCRMMRRIFNLAGSTNFWVALETARRGCVDAGKAAQVGRVDTLYCAFSSFRHNTLDRRPESALAFELLREIINTSDVRDMPLISMRSLTGIANAFRGQWMDLRKKFDSSWMTVSGLESMIVRGSFDRSGSDCHASDLYEESLVHPLDAQTVEAKSRMTKEASSSLNLLTGDSLFGAACLMAVVIECEKWDVYDYSEDQLADLRLGVLQPMAPIFLYRLSGIGDYGMRELSERLSLSSYDAEILELWARQRISFTH